MTDSRSELRGDDASTGLFGKYKVSKIGDIIGKHDRCQFFVLDLTHDPAARRAALEYAVAKNDPDLLRDLAELNAQLGTPS